MGLGGRGAGKRGVPRAKWGAAPPLANGTTLASHLEVLGVYHVVVHSFFIRPALNGIYAGGFVTRKAHFIAILRTSPKLTEIVARHL